MKKVNRTPSSKLNHHFGIRSKMARYFVLVLFTIRVKESAVVLASRIALAPQLEPHPAAQSARHVIADAAARVRALQRRGARRATRGAAQAEAGRVDAADVGDRRARGDVDEARAGVPRGAGDVDEAAVVGEFVGGVLRVGTDAAGVGVGIARRPRGRR